MDGGPVRVANPKWGQPASSRTVTVPAPAGLNLVASPAALGPGECLVQTNIIRSELGARVRSGYRDYVTGLGGAVRSVFGFEGSVAANNRLFAALQDGIYDVTGDGTPTITSGSYSGGDLSLLERVGVNVFMSAGRKVCSFAVQSATSGYGIARSFTTLAGYHFLLYTDEANGYYVYSEATGYWTKVAEGTGAGEINGVDPATFAFVTAWKKRLWFVKKDSTIAYYLPVDQYAGNVQPFDFGPQFKHGGHLVGIWSWTIDAGEGIDDLLVAVSSAGDVVIYGGTDPAYFPEIYLKGVWYIGAVPLGRKLATENGGDLLLLSSLGLMPVSKLVAGAVVNPETGVALTHKISPAINKQMLTQRATRGWATQIHPEDSLLLILTPPQINAPPVQWAMSMPSNTWGKLSGLPMTCAEAWQGKLYFGTSDGRVCINDGNVDDASGDATDIESDVVYGFTDGGMGNLKRLLMARPRFVAENSPSYAVEGRVNFDRRPVASLAGFLAHGFGAGIWDEGLWDTAVWGGENTFAEWRGVRGYGTYVSLALKASTRARTILPGSDLLFDTGGLS